MDKNPIGNKKDSSILRRITNKINLLSGPHWTDLEKVMEEYDKLVRCGVTPDVFVYSSLFKACAERVPPAVGTAIGIWEDMLTYKIKPNTVVFNSIINVFAANGDIEDAEYYFETMRQFNVVPDVQTYNSLINACSSPDKSDLENAEKWFNELRKNNLKPDEHTFNTLIATAANAQNAEKGFEFFKLMESYKVYSNMQTLTTVLKLCAQSSKLKQALNIFETAKNTLQPDTVMWNSLLNVCAKSGNCKIGFKMWKKMRKIKSVKPDAASINAILDLCGQKGDFDKLCETIAQADLLHISLNEYSLPTLINGCVKAGDPKRAFQWFNLFKKMMPCNKIALCNLFRVLSTDSTFTNISLTLFREALTIGIFSEHIVDNRGTLLLTGLPTDVAKVALIFALLDLRNRFKREKGKLKPLEVITGRGKMKEYCISVSGEIGILFRCKRNNIGRLVVPFTSLKNFFMKKCKWEMLKISK